MIKYQPSKIESKYQKLWREKKIYEVDLSKPAKKFYLLVEFTYPSGDLHMGHWFAFAVPDILSRMKRMQGYMVFAPNGFDAFGLPAENAAIKRGIHPKDWTYSNIAKMKDQFQTMGASYDWDHQVITCDPEYYRWNQWIFVKMHEKGLAYRGKALSNWCPSCQTVLANENVEAGHCWRCSTEVVQKEVDQWFLKITDYADRLLWPEEDSVKYTSEVRQAASKLTSEVKQMVNWPKPLITGQNNWIGKSEGIEIKFIVDSSLFIDKRQQNGLKDISVFTKFPETIFGVTYMVIAPEYRLVDQLLSGVIKVDKKIIKDIKGYLEVSKKKSELERKAGPSFAKATEGEGKTGVFTGLYCLNPVNGKKVPIWISDYVIAGYGTGAVMGVPGSDIRDYDFAKEFGLEIIRVIGKDKNDQSEVASASDVLEDGWIVNSGQFNGLQAQHPAKEKFMDFIEAGGWGKRTVNFHLHDWSISRQRYWGTPIPIIYCKNCVGDKNAYQKTSIDNEEYAIIPVPEKDLPVELPYEVDYAPKGKPPLATAKEWVNVTCPNCGGAARREVETMDTFVDSSWYFFRYLDPKNDRQIADKTLLSNWTPVDIYFGGAEHTLGHTLYSRFFTKFLHDIGVVDIEEYSLKRVHHGVILGPNGHRMSKSKGNVVNPDDEVKKYGADAVRLYLAFLGPYDLVAPWNPDGVRGVYHFLQRVWLLGDQVIGSLGKQSKNLKTLPAGRQAQKPNNPTKEDLQIMHKTIKKVTEDIEAQKFNTPVAALMEWLNYLSKKVHSSGFMVYGKSRSVKSMNYQPLTMNEFQTFLKLLAPFAPHITEELWQGLRPLKINADENQRISTDSKNRWISIHQQPWPEYDPGLVVAETVTLVVQINGKVRDSLPVEAGISQKDAEKLALSSEKLQRFVGTKEPRKVIFIPDRLINFVV